MTTRPAGSLDSATLVASTTRRRPSAAGAGPAPGARPAARRAAPAPRRPPPRLPRQRRARVSRRPGRNTSTSPGCRASACSTARRTCASSASSRRAGTCSTCTGWLRPWLDSRGASRNAASRSPSSVADITTIRRSSRSEACTSSASARPRSADRWRSWNSSNSSAPTPGSSGSSWIMRVRMPSVTTSIRVRADTGARSDAVADGAADLLAHPRDHEARGARGHAPRLGITIRRPASHGASSSAGGTAVVLPAPGGASSTSRGCAARRSRIAGSSGVIGRSMDRLGRGRAGRGGAGAPIIRRSGRARPRPCRARPAGRRLECAARNPTSVPCS